MPSATKHSTHARQQGYSLVEVAIALAVVGIILGGAVLPLGNQLREKAYQRANAQIGEAVEAVVGYAITHKSPGFTYLYTDTTSSALYQSFGFRLARVPSGRPYLPCPDTTGDGIEDRTDLVIPTLGSQSGFEYGQDEDGIIRSRRQPARLNDANEPIELADTPLGTCTDHKGALPWRTLGLPSSDPWGSRLTYAVHPMFATAAFGFDQQTRATGHINIVETDFADSIIPPRTNVYPYGIYAGNHFYNPIIPCPVSAANDATDHLCFQGVVETSAGTYPSSLGTGSLNHYSEPAGGFSTAPPGLDPYEYIYYHFSYVPETYYSLGRFGVNSDFRTVTDGLPFVILSHGANRKGAETDDGDSSVDCADAPDESDEPFEYYNSLLGNCVSTSNLSRVTENRQVPVYAQRRAALKASDPAETSEYLNADEYEGNRVFDDVVGWLTRRELQAIMRDRGVFPLPETFHGLLSGKASYQP